MVKLQNTTDKENILNIAREGEKTDYIQRNEDQDDSWLSVEIMKSRSQWNDIYKALRENNYQSRTVYPEKTLYE